MIQWYLARPCIISGQDARTTRNFGIFFKLEVSTKSNYNFVPQSEQKLWLGWF
jgi:hypothetical protein